MNQSHLAESDYRNRLLFGGEMTSVAQQRHETEVHMQLMMAMKQGWAGTIGQHIHFNLRVRGDQQDILPHAGAEFEGMPVQVNRMAHHAAVVEYQPVANTRA